MCLLASISVPYRPIAMLITNLAHVERKRIKLRKVKQSIAGQEALVQAAHSRPRKELLNLLTSVDLQYCAPGSLPDRKFYLLNSISN